MQLYAAARQSARPGPEHGRRCSTHERKYERPCRRDSRNFGRNLAAGERESATGRRPSGGGGSAHTDHALRRQVGQILDGARKRRPQLFVQQKELGVSERGGGDTATSVRNSRLSVARTHPCKRLAGVPFSDSELGALATRSVSEGATTAGRRTHLERLDQTVPGHVGAGPGPAAGDDGIVDDQRASGPESRRVFARLYRVVLEGDRSRRQHPESAAVVVVVTAVVACASSFCCSSTERRGCLRLLGSPVHGRRWVVDCSVSSLRYDMLRVVLD